MVWFDRVVCWRTAFVAAFLALGSGVCLFAQAPDEAMRRQAAIRALRNASGVFSFSENEPEQPVELVFADHFRLTDPDLRHLRDLPTLRTLDLNASVRVYDEGFRHIQHLKELRVLNLGGTRITDRDLAVLTKLTKLETLHLWLTDISDDGLMHIAEFKHLHTLNLWDTQISDKGLTRLTGLKKLRRLCIGRTEALPLDNPLLLDRPLLKELEIPRITRAGVQKLQKALPDVKVFYFSHQASKSISVRRPPGSATRVGVVPRPDSPQVMPNIGTRTSGVDWPSFLGPTRDNKSPETGLVTSWSSAGPPLVWRKRLGDSHGSCAVSKGRLLLFDRQAEQVRVRCCNAETGTDLWTFSAPTAYIDQLGYGNGPRCSPVVDEDRVYAFGADGMLYCISVLDGELIWRCDTASQFGVVQFFFGVGSTPVVEGDLLIVLVGGSGIESDAVDLSNLKGRGAGIVALNKYTGDVVYSVTDALASYASPQLATIDGRRWCFAFARGTLIGIDPSNGKVDFEYPWRARFSAAVSAATPVVVGNEVFISEAYGPGSSLLKVRPGGFEVVWRDSPRSREKALQTHWNTPIYHEGYLYACSGRHPTDGELRCVEWRTGKVMWSELTRSRSSLLYVDGHFVALGEYGELLLFKATPARFELVASTVLKENPADSDSPPLLKYPAWSAPVLSHGLLYVRGKEQLVCLEVIPLAPHPR